MSGSVVIHVGDAAAVLRTLPTDSVDVCVTSPPYWGLRDYGVRATVWGGDADCPHSWGEGKRFCRRCDAWLGCLGLEPTPEYYVANLVAVFREVRRVLKRTGTVWLNLGDSYTSGGRKTRDPGSNKIREPLRGMGRPPFRLGSSPRTWSESRGEWRLPSRRTVGTCAATSYGPSSTRCRRASETGRRAVTSMSSCWPSERYFYDSVASQEPCQSGPSDIRKMLESLPRVGGKHRALDDPLAKASAATNVGRRRAVGGPTGRQPP